MAFTLLEWIDAREPSVIKSFFFFLIPEDLSSCNKEEKNILEEPVPNSFLKIWLMYRHTTLLCLTSICLHYFGIIPPLIGMPFKYTSLFFIHTYVFLHFATNITNIL